MATSHIGISLDFGGGGSSRDYSTFNYRKYVAKSQARALSRVSSISVKAPFKQLQLKGDTATVVATVATNTVASKLKGILRKDVRSVKFRAFNNAGGRGPEENHNLKSHKPLAKLPFFKESVTIKGGKSQWDIRHSFSVSFEPKGQGADLLRYMAKLLEGYPTGSISELGYGDNLRKLAVYAKSPKKYMAVPNPNLSQIPNSPIFSDIKDYRTKDTIDRYRTMMYKYPNKRIADKAAAPAFKAAGFKVLLMGFSKKVGPRMEKGLYGISLAKTRRSRSKSGRLIGSPRRNRPFLLYFLKRRAVLSPRAWFSGALSQWYRGAGGGRNYEIQSQEIAQAVNYAIHVVLSELSKAASKGGK